MNRKVTQARAVTADRRTRAAGKTRLARGASPKASRSARADGDVTRAHLLNTAGQVFAEFGYAGTASKEICQRAGANIAAVNYHFGSKDGLYEAVLVEAHRQIVSLDELLAFTDTGADPRTKLTAVIGHLIGHAARSADSWGTRVLIRELVSPSHLVPALVAKAIKPKAKVLQQLIAAIVQLPAGHPAVQSGLMFTVLPCIALTIAPKSLRAKMFPALDQISAGVIDDVVLYVLAGLDALGRKHRAGG